MTEEEKPKEQVSRPCATLNGTVFESILNDSKPAFLVYEPKHGFTFAESFTEASVKIVPLKKDSFPYQPYTVNRETVQTLAKEASEPEKLFLEVLQEYNLFLDLGMQFKWLEAIQTFETYQQHKIRTTSYLYHEGDIESGKSRALELHFLLDYRPLYCIRPSPANVYRYLGSHGKGKGSVLQDEAQALYKHDELLDIYCMGYRQFAKYPRHVRTSSGMLLQRFFEIFSCKCFAGTWLPKDRAFRDRCIRIPMVEGQPQKDEITDEDIQRFGRLRLKLLAWRMMTYFEDLPEIDTPLKRRSKELWKPKLQIASLVIPNPNNPIVQLSQEMYNHKIEAIKMSLNAQICRAVVSLCNEKQSLELEFSAIWNELIPLVEGEDIGASSVESSIYGVISKRLVGLKLNSVFPCEKKLVRGKGRIYRFKREPLQKLARKYYLEEKLWKQRTLGS